MLPIRFCAKCVVILGVHTFDLLGKKFLEVNLEKNFGSWFENFFPSKSKVLYTPNITMYLRLSVLEAF